MIVAALLMAAFSQDSAPAPKPLDAFMLDVTEACLLPDLESGDPRRYLVQHGWTGKAEKFGKRIGDANYTLVVNWPASAKAAASCSFESDTVAATDVYGWFKHRLGEPNDIALSEAQVAGWKIQTNGHDAGVYVSRKQSKKQPVGMMLHILQN